jgi:dephospho-CoA kinase
MRANPLVIGLSGPLCAGKSTLARYLNVAYGAEVIATRDIVKQETARTNATRQELQELGQALQTQRGALYVTERILARITGEQPYVIDAIRHVVSQERLSAKLGQRFVHVHIAASETVRWERYREREKGDHAAFTAANAHPIESEVDALGNLATALIDNRGTVQQLASQIGGLFHLWRWGRVPVSLQSALEMVRDFHEKHDFDIGTGDPGVLSQRIVLMVEELGEIARWSTRRQGDLAEENADLLILLLGNAVAMDFDLEEALVQKARKIFARPSKLVDGHKRVSHWKRDDAREYSRLDRLRLTTGEIEIGAEPKPQLSFALPTDNKKDGSKE